MYKVDLKTLNKITETLDTLTSTNTQTIEFIKIRIKAK